MKGTPCHAAGARAKPAPARKTGMYESGRDRGATLAATAAKGSAPPPGLAAPADAANQAAASAAAASSSSGKRVTC
ncbi:MAG: hypothetical protein FWJ83_06630 [Limnochordales bacterium]